MDPEDTSGAVVPVITPPWHVASFQTEENGARTQRPSFSRRKLLWLPHQAEAKGDQKDRSRSQGRVFKDRHRFITVKNKELRQK